MSMTPSGGPDSTPALGGGTLAGPPGSGTQVGSQDAPPPHVLAAAGRVTIPGYEVAGEIARGGMGAILAARELSLGREVAIKVLLPGADPGAMGRRFVTEAGITARLQHPGIPPVYALGELADGSPFLAMKLIRGRTLAELLRDRPGPSAELPRFVGVFEQVCQAVAFAHAQGVVHRDLKPGNVMVGAFGEVQVMDWGLAKDLATGRPHPDRTGGEGGRASPDDPADRTAPGDVLGTPAYMPPEQARGEPADERADVFALGGILCAVLTGRPPYTGVPSEVVAKAEMALLDDALGRIAGCGADGELVALAARCLAARPADRPGDAGAVAGAVAAYRAGVEDRVRKAEAERAAAEARAEEARRRADAEERARVAERRRRRFQLALAAAVGVIVLGGGAAAWWGTLQAERQRVRVERTRDGIGRAVAIAADLRGQFRYREAEATLAQARELADGGGADDLRPAIDRAAADLALVRRLDAIRLGKSVRVYESGGTDRRTDADAPPRYFAAFREYGFDLDADSPGGLGARVAASDVRSDLVAALDDWSLDEPDAGRLRRVLDVARRADPGPWTNALRDPAARANAAALWWLARRADPAAASPVAIAVLAELMRRRSLFPAGLVADAYALHPADFTLAHNLGGWYHAAGDPDRAIAHYLAARALRPDNEFVLINLAGVFFEQRRTDEAIAHYRQAIELNPAVPYGHNNLGSCLVAKGDARGAVAAFREAVRIDPNLAAARANLGGALSAAGEHAAAEVECREAIRLAPGMANARHALGFALHEQGRHKEAVASFADGLRLNPSDPKTHYGLGLARRALGDRDGALAAFDEAVRLDPRNASYRYYLGQAWARKGDRVKALAEYRRSAELEPGDAHTHLEVGNTLMALRDPAGAAAAFRAAVRANPAFAGAHVNLGSALAAQGKIAEAVGAVREGVRLDPANPDAQFNLGMGLAVLEDWDGAVAAFRAAARLTPGDPEPHLQVGTILRRRGDPAGAAVAYREAVRAAPEDPRGLLSLALAVRDEGRFAEALGLARKGHDLARRSGRRLPSAEVVRECEEWVRAEEQLAAVAAGGARPTAAPELIRLAEVCGRYRHRYREAVEFYRAAFARDLFGSLTVGDKAAAAKAAALAAGGQGVDPPPPADRPSFRAHALAWLAAELGLLKTAVSLRTMGRDEIHAVLAGWVADPAFAAVRHPLHLAALPTEESRAWLTFWSEVGRLLDRTGPPTPAPPPREVLR